MVTFSFVKNILSKKKKKKKKLRGGLKTGSQVTAAHLTASARVKDVKNRLTFTAGFFSLLHSINAMI